MLWYSLEGPLQGTSNEYPRVFMEKQEKYNVDTPLSGAMRVSEKYFLFHRKMFSLGDWLIVLGFNDTSTLEGHFVSSPREREKRDRRESRGDEREGQGRKRNRNESEETEEIKTFPLYPYPLQG